jgi:excisionase family DNA binding protein
MSKAKGRRARRKHAPGAQRPSARSNGGALKKARPKLSSADARLNRPGNDSDTKAVGSANVRSRHNTRSGLPRSYSIPTIAEAVGFSARTVRRWIASGKLIAHRVGNGFPRITEDDFRAFWALYRDG